MSDNNTTPNAATPVSQPATENSAVQTSTTFTNTSTPVATPAPQKDENKNIVAISGFVVSLFNLCAWFIPLCGCPMAILGIGLCAYGLKSEKYKVLAIIGLVISILGLIATIANGFAGALLAVGSN